MTNSELSLFLPDDSPVSFGFLVLPDSNMLSLAASVDPLRAANRRADRRVFSWTFYSPSGGNIALTTGVSFATAPLPARPDFDVLVIIAGFNLTTHATPRLMRHLRDLAPRLRALGGVDGGGWVLARSGLLDGQTATTHWEDLEEFADVFPKVNVVRDRFTLSGKFFTTGGAAPAIDMMLHLIRSRLGAGIADAVASAFIYDSALGATRPQLPVATARLRTASPHLAQAVEIMASEIEFAPSIAAIAARIGLSPRRLEMLFATHTATSPGAYFLGLRLQEARRLLTDRSLSVQNIALRTGFSSQAVFARAFRREFGVSARVFRRLNHGGRGAIPGA